MDINGFIRYHLYPYVPVVLFRCDMMECAREYCFDGIGQGVKVLDIGVYTGGFSFICEKHGATVIGVEPLIYPSLHLNRLLNRCKFKILNIAHGDGQERECEWQGKKKTLKTYTLTEIYQMAFFPDFIKIDTEGSEWLIKPEELAGVPRFEIEFHYRGQENPDLIKALEKTHNIFWYHRTAETKIAHGFKKGVAGISTIDNTNSEELTRMGWGLFDKEGTLQTFFSFRVVAEDAAEDMGYSMRRVVITARPVSDEEWRRMEAEKARKELEEYYLWEAQRRASEQSTNGGINSEVKE